MSRPIDVQLNWEPTGFQSPFFLGQERGYYEAEGLEIRLVGARGGGVGTGSPFAVERVAEQKCAFGWAGGAGHVLAASRGHEAVAVAGVTHHTPAAFFTLEEIFGGSLEEPEQLAGTTIAPTATKTSILAQLFLRDLGIRDDVHVLGVDKHTHHRPQRKLLEGTVDAVVGVVTNGEELGDEYEQESSEISIGRHLPVYGMSLVTHPAFARENRDTVAAFLRASARSWADAVAEPDAAIDALVARNSGLEYTRSIERRKLEWMLSEFVEYDVFSERWGAHDGQRWAELVSRMEAANAIESPVDSGELWTDEYLDDSDPITQFPTSYQ